MVAFGPPALEALGTVIETAKAGDPLAPVTVAVPSALAGLAARRALGSRPRGLVNCQFVPLARVAELLGAPALATTGRLPLPDGALAEAIRGAVASAPGPIASAARHPRTLRSLEATLAALRGMPASLLDRLAEGSARADEVVRLYRAARQRLRAWYDEHDLLRAAAAAVRAHGCPALRDVGQVVLYLPRQMSAAELDLCAALAGVGLLSAVLGATGDVQADEQAWALADQLAGLLGPGTHAAPSAPPVADRVVSAPDPTEEVRAAIREIMARLRRDGRPLHQAAILYPTANPYAVIAAEELGAAGIPFNGPGTRALAQTAAGRCLRSLLDLTGGGGEAPQQPGTDLDRRSVMAWLSGCPILERPRGKPVPAAAWERIARQAGIVRGDWSMPLKRLEAGEYADRLAAFVEELLIRLDTGGLGSWRDLSRWAGGLLDRYLAPEPWPLGEREAAHRVRAAVSGLAALDGIAAGTPDLEAFRQAVARALTATAGYQSQFSAGVFVGSLADAPGMDFDLVVVVGMAEGHSLAVDGEELLLPQLRRTHHADQRRDYLAALATARCQRVLCFPRSDPRAGRARLPSRWLLEAAGHHAGRTVYAQDLAALEAPWYQRVPSFAGGLGASEPASPRDRDLASLASWGGDLARHPLVAADPGLARGIEAQRARAGAGLTVWDGHTGPHPLLAARSGEPVSPAALQRYAICGMRYLLGEVLGVESIEEPDEAIEISPLDRGMLVHDVLARFARGEGTLATLAEQECDRLAGAQAPLLWAAEQERIESLLARFTTEDERLHAELGTVRGEVEVPFEIAVALPEGGTVTLRGRIDRLDHAPDGSRAVAIDYKTGRSQPYRQALRSDPIAGGQLLALPAYALAGRAQLGGGQARATYWFLRDLDEFELVGLDLDDEALRRFAEALGVIVAGIEAGRFPARRAALAASSLESCDRCPYDLVCPADRVRAWERKRQAAELAEYVALVDKP